MKILSTLDILGAEDETAVNMAKAIALRDAIEKSKKKEPAAAQKSPGGITDAALIATILIVGASPILGGVWLYKRFKK